MRATTDRRSRPDGRISSRLARDLARDHEVRLLDVAPIGDPPVEAIQGNVADWATVETAVRGMDAVAHLAIHMPKERPVHHEYMQGDVDTGVKGTDLLFYAATACGRGRVRAARGGGAERGAAGQGGLAHRPGRPGPG